MDNRIRRRYAHVFRSLGRAELQANAPDAELSLGDLFEPASEPLWLGFYTRDGLELALERYGFLDEVRALGYEELTIELSVEDEEQMFRLKSALPRSAQPLVELVARRSHLSMRDDLSAQFSSASLPILSVEWLLLQNPLRDFDEDRLPLPGQLLPGLGLGRQVFELLRNICRRLELGALVTVPSFLHNAVLYGEEFRFMDPRVQGRFEAIIKALRQEESAQGLGLAHWAWALRWGMILEHQGQALVPLRWFHEPMCSAVSDAARAVMEGAWYRREVEQAREELRFSVAREALMERLARRGIHPFDGPVVQTWIGEDARELG